MKFFQEDYIKNFPDFYSKDKNSNNYKLMQLLKYDRDKFLGILKEIDDSLDLEKATGYTLNLYGDMISQNRGLANDSQYLFMIKTKLARNRVNSDYKSIAKCICLILDCMPSDIYIEELPNSKVRLGDIPIDKIIKADITPNQFTQIIKSMLPAGITLETSVYSGTFAFSDVENEETMDAGFCQNEGDNYGGYFGMLSDEENEKVLPI